MAEDKVKIIRPSDLTGYTFQYNPYIDHNVEHLQVEHELDSGLTASYDKKFKIHFTLSWAEPKFFRGTQLEALRTIFNSLEGLCIYPSPVDHPNCVYAVRWRNGFDFHPVRGNVLFGYEGTIELEGTRILTEVDQYLVMANTF